MYEPPIKLLITDIEKQIEEQAEQAVYQAALHFVPDVNLSQLRLALQYDRGQYEKGYADGKHDAMEELVRCPEVTDRFSDAFGSIASYNGHEEWLWEVADKLREVEEGKNFCLEVPPEEWRTDRHALWMMLVSAFGDWGTSIRSGWINQTKAAADFIDEATERHAEWRKDGEEDG